MSKFEQKTYNDGEILFNSGDKAETFFIIKQGKIKIFDPSTNVEIAVLNTGESFGEQSFISQGVRSASASAVGSTMCLEITAKALRDLLEKEEGIAAPVLQALLLQMYMQNELRSKN